MTECRDIQPILSTLVDEELPPEWRAFVEAHLAGCEACRARAAELRELADGLAAMPKAEPGEEFLAGVRQRVSDGEGPPVETPGASLLRKLWVLWPVRAVATVTVFAALAALLPSAYNAVLRAKYPEQFAKAKPQQYATVTRRAEPSAERAGGAQEQRLAAPSAAYANKVDADRVIAGTPSAPLAKAPAEAQARAKPVTSSGVIVVETTDMTSTRKVATRLAFEFGGRLKAVDFAGSRLSVELPISQVAAFRDRLTQNERKDKSSVGDDLGLAGAKASADEATTVLEIQMVPPAR